MEPQSDITILLGQLKNGDETALSQLMPLLYDEMRDIAKRHFRRERSDHTLQPTALLNEAYLKLIEQRNQSWENRSHFLSVASTAMRRVLMHHASKKNTEKRGGERDRITLFEAASIFEERAEDLLALDEALDRLAEFDPQNAKIVELRFFCGLTNDETAEVLGVSTRTVERGWRVARAWLKSQIDGADGREPADA